jgi:hypothetical protein
LAKAIRWRVPLRFRATAANPLEFLRMFEFYVDFLFSEAVPGTNPVDVLLRALP